MADERYVVWYSGLGTLCLARMRSQRGAGGMTTVSFLPTRRMCVYGRSAPFSTRSLPLESCVTLEKAQPCRSEGPCTVWLRVDVVILGDIHMPAGL